MGLRWTLSLSTLEISPNFELFFRQALQALPEEDVLKQERFHFRNDSLACVAGRIMMRAATNVKLGVPWHKIEINRTDRGKPLLHNNPMFFNISHQGDLVVLATSKNCPIGVDVMRIDEERNTSAEIHINRMKHLFSEEEVQMMLSQDGETARWTAFYRVWCLKEAVLKATGVGLVNDLNNHSFNCSSGQKHIPGNFITDTKYCYKAVQQGQWGFEESFIGSDHCVAVGKLYESADVATQANLKRKTFDDVSLDFLLRNSTPLSDENVDAYERYRLKPWKNH